MRKINLLLANAAIATALLLSSCKKDEDETEAKGPSIVLQKTADGVAIDADKTVLPGTPLTFKVDVTKGDKALQDLTFFRGTDALNPTAFKVDGDNEKSNPFNVSTGKSYLITIDAIAEEGVTLYQFQVKDKDGKIASTKVNVTTKNVGGAIITHTAQKLGAANSDGSGENFYDIINGKVYAYKDVDASTDQDIDLGFHTTVVDGIIFKAPSDYGFGGGNNDAKDWDKSNKTAFFKTTLTVADFDAIQNDVKLTDLNFGASFLTLALGTVEEAKAVIVAFKTEAGKIGVIKVTDGKTSNGPDGSVTFDIKIQK